VRVHTLFFRPLKKDPNYKKKHNFLKRTTPAMTCMNTSTRQAMYVQSDVETRSRNLCCLAKARIKPLLILRVCLYP